MKRKFKIAASMMCADILNIKSEIKELIEEKVDYLHLDVMDGHFVNNITLGIDFCRRMAGFGVPRDIHMLMLNPERYLLEMELKKNDIFQVHYESGCDLARIEKAVHERGALFGVVLNPETEIEVLKDIIFRIDVITLMMIVPGFAGLPMEKGVLEKIKRTRTWLDTIGATNIVIEIDGHVNSENISTMYKNGGRIFVVGTSSVFRDDVSIKEGIRLLEQSIEK